MNMWETLKSWEKRANGFACNIKLLKQFDEYFVEYMLWDENGFYHHSDCRRYKSRNAAMNRVRAVLREI